MVGRSGRGVPCRVEPVDGAGRFVVISDRLDGIPARQVVVGRPSLVAARRWCRTLRRVDRVVLAHSADGWAATIHGVGHRRAVRCQVSIDTALALVLGGVPAGLIERSSEARPTEVVS